MTSTDLLSSEYRRMTSGCGLLDRSERGKLALLGAEAKTFLQGQVTNEIEGLGAGQGCYAAFLTPKGKMLGDLRILDAGEQILLDTERVSLQQLFNMIRRFSIGFQVELHKRTLEQGLLSLVGPESESVAGVSGLPAPEHSHVAFEVAGAAVRAIRTDIGVDLLCDASDTESLRAALEEAGAASVSESVFECLRIERGRPRYGLDLDDTVIPQEAGLNDRAVSFTKGCYVGQETVARLYYRGKPNRHLRGLLLPAAAQPGDEVSLDGRIVGRLGSVAQSPELGWIALALVRREAAPGATVSVGAGVLTGSVVELPFR
jgi:tRNA-modifying protein YgfZ